ncbi:MAG: DUF4249 family protein [Flavobacteriales bacterium]|nr:MAG: DUF4249 family protein [Flavobacteriales bacterium]
MRTSIPVIVGAVCTTFLLFSGCTKDITVVPLAYDTKPVIECMLTPGQVPKLYIYRSVPYFDAAVTRKSLFIRTANVTITSSLGTDVLVVDSVEDLFACEYNYFFKGNIVTQPNITFSLNIDAEGKTYTAQTTTDQTATTITSTGYTPVFNDIYGEHEGVIVDYNDVPGEENFYRYQMARIIDSTTTLGEGGLFSICTHGSFFPVLEIGRAIYKDANQDGLPQEIVIEPAYKHKSGDIGYIRMQSVDKNAAVFYDQLDRQKLSQFNPFVEPVFLTPIQFPEALGVFGSYALSDSVVFVFPE